MFKKSEDRDLATASLLRIGGKQPIRSKNVSVIGGHIEGTIAHHKKFLTKGKQEYFL